MRSLAAPETTTSELFESYFAAESRRDVRAVVEHFREDAVLVLPDGRTLSGRGAIGEFYAEVYAQLAELDVHVVSMSTAAGITAVEWEASLVYESNDTQTLRGVNVVRTSAGMFAEVRTYFGPRA